MHRVFAFPYCISVLKIHICFQSYGYEHLVTFNNLKRAGLLFDQPDNVVNLSKVGVRKSKFASVAKSLDLLPTRKTECDFRNPKDVSYLSNGAYIPLSYRLIEQVGFFCFRSRFKKNCVCILFFS